MKKIYWAMMVAGLVALGWYLFVRSHEFEVNLKTNTLPGDVIETIRLWNRTLDSARILEVDSTYRLKQRMVVNGRTYVYDWHFDTINDTTTRVNIEITEPCSSLKNKLLIPFSNQPIEQDAKAISSEFYNILKTHLNITSVKLNGEAELPPLFCACRTMETDQIDKANGMMTDYGLLTSFMSEFNLEVNGPPIVMILSWNHNLGKLKYDFCFPVVKSDSLPVVAEITYKEIKNEKVLKATYHGNYITSDRAWYALMHYAKTNGYEITGLPIEYFHNNPNLGLNEKEWKAEVFLPVRKNQETEKN